MSFVVHTEELNLVCVVAAEVDDASSGDSSDGDEQHHHHHPEVGTFASHCHEMLSVFHLALPTVTIQLGGVIPSFLTASYIGRNFSVTYLDGFTLASLTGNLFTLSLLQGLYSASDTLSPQAYGAGNAPEVGYLAIRGYVGSMLVTLPSILLLAGIMNRVLVAVGEDAEAATHAWRWYQIYAISLPFYALYQVTWKFLSAQNVMAPLVVCALVSCCVVLPMALYAAGTAFGFLGTAAAIVIYQVFLSLSLLAYLWHFQPHNPSTWPGLKQGWKQALQWKPMYAYMALGAGGMLASSEWIYWETLSLIIGTFGVVPLSVHTIPTQVIMVTFMVPLGIGIALSIRMGATLPVSVARAKQTVIDCLVVGVFLFGAIATVMYTKRHAIFSWFTTSDAVKAGCEEIWWKVCMYSFHLGIFGVLMGACVGLGMQWTLGITTIVVLWIFGLPAAYYMSVVQGGGLNAAWSAIWPPYFIINFILATAIIRADWEEIAHDIRRREGAELVILKPGDVEVQSFIDTYGSTQSHSNKHVKANGKYQGGTS